MANANICRGLWPVVLEPDDCIIATAETSTALFLGSPVKVVAGVATAAGHGDSDLITGSVVAIRNTAGASKCNKPATTANWVVEVTHRADQKYVMLTDAATNYANGTWFNITATEGATADTASTAGDTYSTIKLECSAAGAASGKQLIAGGATGASNNDVTAAGAEVFVRIAPTAHHPVAR